MKVVDEGGGSSTVPIMVTHKALEDSTQSLLFIAFRRQFSTHTYGFCYKVQSTGAYVVEPMEHSSEYTICKSLGEITVISNGRVIDEGEGELCLFV